MEEHENLLALLAQQDIEKASLCAALQKVGGKEAVDIATNEAQEEAFQKYGEYIQVSW